MSSAIDLLSDVEKNDMMISFLGLVGVLTSPHVAVQVSTEKNDAGDRLNKLTRDTLDEIMDNAGRILRALSRKMEVKREADETEKDRQRNLLERLTEMAEKRAAERQED